MSIGFSPEILPQQQAVSLVPFKLQLHVPILTQQRSSLEQVLPQSELLDQERVLEQSLDRLSLVMQGTHL